MSCFVSYRIGKLAAPQPIKGLSFINSNALSQIENLAFEVKISRFSNIENLAINFDGKILIANSLKIKGNIFVTAAINKVINKIKKRNNHIDMEPFKNIKEDKNRLNNPTRENVK